MSIVSVLCITEKFFCSNAILDVPKFDRVGNIKLVMVECNSLLFQHHSDACGTILAPASYCEPDFMYGAYK